MYIDESIKVTAVHAALPGSPLALPEFLAKVQAGFPSPAEDYVERALDLNELMIKHPAATFFVKVEGNSMEGANIYSGDILVVDRSLEPSNGKVVVAVLNGEFTVKRIAISKDGIKLMSENTAYPHFTIDPDSDFQVWGVVTYVIHKPR